MPILEVNNLIKKFGNFFAVNDISFSLAEGEILGLLGPNGAGKTTTIQMILGVLTPTSGEVRYFGRNFAENRSEILEQVNFSSTYTNLPWLLKVKENLKFISYLYDIPDRKRRIEKIVQIFQLEELLNLRISDLSSGQITRVNLAKAFLNFPKVLLLDEPTASLDPESATYIRKFLLNEREKFQTSIIFTSHNMAEVEEVCDRVIFINHGKIIADNTPQNLAKTIDLCHIQLFPSDPQALLDYCKKKNVAFRKEGKYFIITVSEKNLAKLLQNLVAHKIGYDEISIEKPTLEDFFIKQATKK